MGSPSDGSRQAPGESRAERCRGSKPGVGVFASNSPGRHRRCARTEASPAGTRRGSAAPRQPVVRGDSTHPWCRGGRRPPGGARGGVERPISAGRVRAGVQPAQPHQPHPFRGQPALALFRSSDLGRSTAPHRVRRFAQFLARRYHRPDGRTGRSSAGGWIGRRAILWRLATSTSPARLLAVVPQPTCPGRDRCGRSEVSSVFEDWGSASSR